jgi:hypothetical protein
MGFHFVVTTLMRTRRFDKSGLVLAVVVARRAGKTPAETAAVRVIALAATLTSAFTGELGPSADKPLPMAEKLVRRGFGTPILGAATGHRALRRVAWPSNTRGR